MSRDAGEGVPVEYSRRAFVVALQGVGGCQGQRAHLRRPGGRRESRLDSAADRQVARRTQLGGRAAL